MSHGYQPGVMPEWMNSGGTAAHQAELARQLRDRPMRDLRHPARVLVDHARERAQADVVRAHGRPASFDPNDYPDGAVHVLLSDLERAEEHFVQLAQVPHVAPAAVQAAQVAALHALGRFLTCATRGWPTAAQHAREVARRQGEMGMSPLAPADEDGPWDRAWRGR
jgi:hypothetical protein